MIDPILSLAHTVQSNRGTMALLLGSGLSRSAGVPTGWEVTLDLIRRVATMVGEDPGAKPESWYEARYGSPPGYSDLLDLLARTPAERRAILHKLFEPTDEERDQGLKLPTRAHKAIADLVAQGFVKVIVTTNFDRLTELALEAAGVTPVVISTADAVKGAAPLVHQRCVVLKVHGDYLDARIKNTDAELSAYDPAMDAYLDRILDEFGLLVCGWSGEWDQALRGAIERCPSRRYATYWAGTRAPGPKATRLVGLRGAEFIQIAGADEFFESLTEKVTSLEEMGAASPLSAGAAVAAVKRYVAEPRFRIRFDDLLSDEVRRVRKRHAEECRADERPWDPASIRSRMLGYDRSTEVLRSILFEASRWAQPEHHDAIVRAFSALAPATNNGGLVVWLKLEAYPASLAFYAACAGAEVAGNYALLTSLFRSTYRFDGKRREALPDLCTRFVIEKEFASELQDEARYTPLSDHFAEVLAPVLAEASADAEWSFDRLEVLMALAQVDRNEDPERDVRFPDGRFSWKHGDAVCVEIFEEAGRMGAAWPPLLAGMFHGDPERFKAVRSAFDGKLRKSANRFH